MLDSGKSCFPFVKTQGPSTVLSDQDTTDECGGYKWSQFVRTI